MTENERIAVQMLQRLRDPVPAQFRERLRARWTAAGPGPATAGAWRLFAALCERPAGLRTPAACALTGLTSGTLRNAATALRRYLEPLRIDVVVERGTYRLSEPFAAQRELTRLREIAIADAMDLRRRVGR